MSFKRDGDDKHALNMQRKRRVADLLYEDIQDGEVTKLKNGRYVCKVCKHAPTFDTINIFQIHKQGKKHQNSLLYLEEKEQELQDLIFKRQHEKEIRSETENTQVSIEDGKPLQLELKKRSKLYHRKIAVELDQSPLSNFINATPRHMLPGNRLERQTEPLVSEMQPKERTELTGKADKSFHSQSRDKGFVPGAKHNRLSEPVENNEKELELRNVRKFVNQGGENNSSKFYFSRRQQNSSKHVPNVQMNLERQHAVVEKHTALSWDKFKQMKGKSFVAPVYQNKERQEKPADKDNKGNSSDGAVCTLEAGNQPLCSVSTTITKQRAQEFLKAFGSGWKRDWDGNWIKDEDAEFDSDEEPPNIT